MTRPERESSFLGEADDISLLQVLPVLWANRLTIVASTAVFIFLAIIYLHMAVYTYLVTLTLVPTQAQSQGLGSQFSGLASLAGIELPRNQTASPFMLYTESARTRDVADDIIAHAPNIMQRLFRGDWDDATGTWRQPTSSFGAVTNIIKPILGIPVYPWKQPDGANLQQFVIDSVRLVQVANKPMITMSFSSPDPDLARDVLQVLHDSTDRILRRMMLDRASQYAKYLQDKLSTTQTSDVRQVLMQSLSEQTTVMMMGGSNSSFAAQPLSAPLVSLRPVSPQPKIVLILGALLGAIFGGVIAILRTGIRRTAVPELTSPPRDAVGVKP